MPCPARGVLAAARPAAWRRRPGRRSGREPGTRSRSPRRAPGPAASPSSRTCGRTARGSWPARCRRAAGERVQRLGAAQDVGRDRRRRASRSTARLEQVDLHEPGLVRRGRHAVEPGGDPAVAFGRGADAVGVDRRQDRRARRRARSPTGAVAGWSASVAAMVWAGGAPVTCGWLSATSNWLSTSAAEVLRRLGRRRCRRWPARPPARPVARRHGRGPGSASGTASCRPATR